MTNQDGLYTKDLVVRYGGNVAVDAVSLHAPVGRMTGLIGPNGAGKTTLFNACSGLLRPASGTVWFHGQDVTSLQPASRARRGLGRTFQRMELFDSLSVTENVAMGREAALIGGSPLRQVVPRHGDSAAVRAATDDAIELCGIGDLRHRAARALSTGERRLVELARALAGSYQLLLLDEPSSGLDGGETARFGQILRRAIDERGLGILLVEHDMGLVLNLCEHIFVLDFGVLLFQGSAGEVRDSDEVRAAYLGNEMAC